MATFIKIKCVLLGYENSGKSSLVYRYINNKFKESVQSTIGCAFNIKICNLDNIEIKLEIWDTAGSEHYKSLLPIYYRNADIILICIDLSIHTDADIVDYWVGEIDEHIDIGSREVYIVGTKSDIKIDINQQKIKDCLIKYPEFLYVETSSKNNLNISKLFKNCVTAIINNKIKVEENFINKSYFEINEKETNCFNSKCYIH